MKKLLSYLVLLATISFSAGCKKNIVVPEEVDQEPPSEKSLKDEYENKVKDSVWYYYKVFSLWEQYIPPRTSLINKIDEENYLRDNYTQYFKTGEDVLDHLMGLTKQTKQEVKDNYDWYSFIDRNGFISGAVGEGRMTNLGLDVVYIERANDSGNADLYIRMAEVNSLAYKVGLRRGDQILTINGDNKIDYRSQEAIGFSTINAYLNSYTELQLSVKKMDGTIVEKSVGRSSYNANPIIDRRVLDFGERKVGYIAYNSFVGLDGAFEDQGAVKTMKQSFDDLFADFESKGVNELVVDLRYNGGGSVLTAEYLADWIVPLSDDKQLMYTYAMNTLLTREGWTEEGDEFGPVYFSKKGRLNFNRVYFLVSSSTASASELLINSLKPYLRVYLIGTYAVEGDGPSKRVVAENTYGKPAGFFGYPIVDKGIELYVTSFKMYNKNKEGDYFKGLEPESHVWEFSEFYDFGNPSEAMLSAALNHIKTGSFAAATLKRASSSKSAVINRTRDVLKLTEPGKINGMFKFYNETLRLKE